MLDTSNSLIATTGASSTELDNLVVPLGYKMIAYANNINVYKLGDAVTRFNELPVFLDANKTDQLTERLKSIPEPTILSSDVGKLLAIDNETGKNYVTTNFNKDMFLTRHAMLVTMANKSMAGHSHDSLYHTKTDINQMHLHDRSSLKAVKEQDILSWLTLNNMEREEHSKFEVFDGFGEEFIDKSGITKDINFEYSEITPIGSIGDSEQTIENYFVSVDGHENNAILESDITKVRDNVDHVRVFIRYNEKFMNGRMEGGVWGTMLKPIKGGSSGDYVFEVSRDGGTTWCPVELTFSALSDKNNIQPKIVVGTTTFAPYQRVTGVTATEHREVVLNFANAKLVPISTKSVFVSKLPTGSDDQRRIAVIESSITGFPLSKLKVGYCFADPENPEKYIVMCSGLNAKNQFFHSEDSSFDFAGVNRPLLVYPGPPNRREKASVQTDHPYKTYRLEEVIEKRTYETEVIVERMKPVPIIEQFPKVVPVTTTTEKEVWSPCHTLNKGKKGTKYFYSNVKVKEKKVTHIAGSDGTTGHQGIVNSYRYHNPAYLVTWD